MKLTFKLVLELFLCIQLKERIKKRSIQLKESLKSKKFIAFLASL